MMKKIYTPGHRVQRFTSVSNGMGGYTQTWVTLYTIDGYLRTLNGDERVSADKVTLYSTHRFYCEPIEVTEADRYVGLDNKIYNIKLPDNKKAGTLEYTQLDIEYSGQALV